MPQFFGSPSLQFTPAQSTAYLTGIKNVILQEESPQFVYNRTVKVDAVKGLGFLKNSDPSPLLEKLADGSDEHLRTVAVISLSKCRGGMTSLVKYLSVEDGRAKTAIYALRAAIRWGSISEARALDLLKQVPRKRITVAKEVVRLVAELETVKEAAREVLMEISKEEKLHQDVAAALIQALYRLLPDERIWKLAEGYVADQERMAPAIAALEMPFGLMTPAELDFAVEHLLLPGLKHKEMQVREAVFGKLRHPKVKDPKRFLVPRLMEILGENSASTQLRTEQLGCISCFLSLYDDDPSIACTALKSLFTRLPAAAKFLEQLESRAKVPSIKPVVLAVLDLLKPLPIFQMHRVRLVVAADLVFDRLIPVLSEGNVHADTISLLDSLLQRVGKSHPAETAALEQELRKNEQENYRRIGFTLLMSLSRKESWTPKLRALLDEYKNDSSVMISTKAKFTTIPDLVE
jgi:hypothetical protein